MLNATDDAFVSNELYINVYILVRLSSVRFDCRVLFRIDAAVIGARICGCFLKASIRLISSLCIISSLKRQKKMCTINKQYR